MCARGYEVAGGEVVNRVSTYGDVEQRARHEARIVAMLKEHPRMRERVEN